ncbi:MAG: lactate racemase domain-containing protein [Anaerolineae bacterium]
MVVGKGYEQGYLSESETRELMAEGLEQADLSGRRVLILIPDGTRSVPMPVMFRLFHDLLADRVAALDYLVALGTHQPMSDAALSRLVGQPVTNGKVGNTRIFNHRWDRPETFATLGIIPAATIEEISGGLLSMDVPVRLNRLILDYDYIFICGPTFPHEVVGFSGGNKYFFPGISGPEVINFSHWLGALITSYKIIGTPYTPVRSVIDQAAALIERPQLCFSMVVQTDESHNPRLAGLYIGSPQEAYAAAADLSSRLHIVWVEQPYRRVLSVMPSMYDDIWTAAKGMYKMEPAIADGGEVVIYAPHIDEISYTHGHIIDQIGYHVRDYFVKQWDRFKEYPWGVLAHSTHLRGMGTYQNGIEEPRIRVTLATRIPRERCERVNLGYMDPDDVHLDEWQGREGEGILVVPKAGEMLYRVKSANQQVSKSAKRSEV